MSLHVFIVFWCSTVMIVMFLSVQDRSTHCSQRHLECGFHSSSNANHWSGWSQKSRRFWHFKAFHLFMLVNASKMIICIYIYNMCVCISIYVCVCVRYFYCSTSSSCLLETCNQFNSATLLEGSSERACNRCSWVIPAFRFLLLNSHVQSDASTICNGNMCNMPSISSFTSSFRWLDAFSNP